MVLPKNQPTIFTDNSDRQYNLDHQPHQSKPQQIIGKTAKDIADLFIKKVSNKLNETTQKISEGVQKLRAGLGEVVSHTAGTIIDTTPPVILDPVKETYKTIEGTVQNMIKKEAIPTKLDSTGIEKNHQNTIKNIAEIKHELSTLRYQKIGLMTKIRKNPTSDLISQRKQDIIQIEDTQKQYRLILGKLDTKRKSLWESRQQYRNDIANILAPNIIGSNEASTKRTNVIKSNNPLFQLKTFAKLMSYDNVFAVTEYEQGSFNKVKLYTQENTKKTPTYVGNIELNMITSRLNNKVKVEANKVEANKVEANKVEANKVEANKVEANKVEANKVEANKVEAQIMKSCTEILENINSPQNSNLIEQCKDPVIGKPLFKKVTARKKDWPASVDLYKQVDIPLWYQQSA